MGGLKGCGVTGIGPLVRQVLCQCWQHAVQGGVKVVTPSQGSDFGVEAQMTRNRKRKRLIFSINHGNQSAPANEGSVIHSTLSTPSPARVLNASLSSLSSPFSILPLNIRPPFFIQHAQQHFDRVSRDSRPYWP
ncbi:hypothetical protein IQ07DRAFT_605398 [Pyrenochaeta sp. DS3sAY3a]|nr:hypothetical protein IQ07DRAFT_605398 [Pyrenochaeta sp. DS3sAY3a]